MNSSFATIATKGDYWLFSQSIADKQIDDNTVIGVACAVDAQEYADVATISLYDHSGSSYVVSSNGAILMKPKDTTGNPLFGGYSILSMLQEYHVSETDRAKLADALLNGTEYSFTATISGVTWLIQSQPSESDRSIVVAVPISKTAQSTYSGLRDEMISIATVIALLAAILFVNTYFGQKRTQELSIEQTKAKTKSDFMYTTYYGSNDDIVPAFQKWITGQCSLEDIIAANDGFQIPDLMSALSKEPIGTASEGFTVLETSLLNADVIRTDTDADIGLILNDYYFTGNLAEIEKGSILLPERFILKGVSAKSYLTKYRITGASLKKLIEHPIINGNEVNAMIRMKRISSQETLLMPSSKLVACFFPVSFSARAPNMRVPEITARTHLSRPAVSHHLQILKDTGLIRMPMMPLSGVRISWLIRDRNSVFA